MSAFKTLCLELETSIQTSYEAGVSMEEAEKLASKFLYAQMQVSNELRKADLDSRMQKSGLKAIRSTIYLDEVSKADKKPSDVLLEAIVNINEVVQGQQNALDLSEVTRDELNRYYSIFQNAHIHFRSIAKGSFGG